MRFEYKVLIFLTVLAGLVYYPELKSWILDPAIVHDRSGRSWYQMSSGDNAEQSAIEHCHTLDNRAAETIGKYFCCRQRDENDCDLPRQD